MSNENIRSVSEIISDEEISQFYALLPKMQKAQHFLDSLQDTEDTIETTNKPSPYIVELNVDCKVSKKGNDALSGLELVDHENRKFHIDFIVKDYKEFINQFFNNITESLTHTCNQIYANHAEEKHE